MISLLANIRVGTVPWVNLARILVGFDTDGFVGRFPLAALKPFRRFRPL